MKNSHTSQSAREGTTTSVSGLEQRHATQVEGRLLCFDRLLVFGTLMRLQNPAAIGSMLHDAGPGAFDLKLWAMPLSAQVRANADALAKQHGLTIEFVADRKVRKEDLVQARLAGRGPAPGLVCILSAMEPSAAR